MPLPSFRNIERYCVIRLIIFKLKLCNTHKKGDEKKRRVKIKYRKFVLTIEIRSCNSKFLFNCLVQQNLTFKCNIMVHDSFY